jgi:putative addiction module component (TIGR02574 family)
MAVRIDSLGIDQMSVRDRLDLVEQIWDSLREQVEPQDIPEWHRAELAQRWTRAEADPGGGLSWREVVQRLEQRP